MVASYKGKAGVCYENRLQQAGNQNYTHKFISPFTSIQI